MPWRQSITVKELGPVSPLVKSSPKNQISWHMMARIFPAWTWERGGEAIPRHLCWRQKKEIPQIKCGHLGSSLVAWRVCQTLLSVSCFNPVYSHRDKSHVLLHTFIVYIYTYRYTLICTYLYIHDSSFTNTLMVRHHHACILKCRREPTWINFVNIRKIIRNLPWGLCRACRTLEQCAPTLPARANKQYKQSVEVRGRRHDCIL